MNKLSRLLGTTKVQSLPTDILSLADKEKFKNYHLPLFSCPSCAREWRDPHGNGSMINLMGSPCVSCWYSVHLKEFSALSFSQFQKQDFAFHLDIDSPKHQEIIQQFQRNVLWECDQCGKHNLNLPKNNDGNPDVSVRVHCEGCSHPYEHERDLLPFWALKQIGFDDGDDSTNVYELKKLWETQLLWLQALAKARKGDNHTGNNRFEERKKLIAGLERIKSKSRWISGGKWRDGTQALAFLEEYLFGKTIAISHQVQREIAWYTRAIIETNNSARKTPYPENANLAQKYLFNLLHLDTATMFWSTVGGAVWIIWILWVLEKTIEIEIEGSYHRASIIREDKGTLDLDYALYRDEPKYNEDDEEIQYQREIDSSWVEIYKVYAQNPDFYRLQVAEWVSKKNNGYETLDTGRDEWVSQTCPDTSSDDSWGGSGGWYSPSGGGSDGMGFWGSGDMFYKPERNIIIDGIPTDEITSLSPLWDTSWQFNFSLMDIIASPAYAESCGYYRDVTVSAERFITVQEYQVWDWKTQTTFPAPRTVWIDTETTLEELETQYLQDRENQRIIARDIIREIDTVDSEGKKRTIEIPDVSQWFILDQNVWTQCEITKSYLLYILGWISAQDIDEQCKF